MVDADRTLGDLARIIRSKNAGPFRLTLDVILPDDETYELVRASGVLAPERVADLYGTEVSQITDYVEYPAARAIKITLVRPTGAGGPDDTDVYGCQQHAPLLELVLGAEGTPG